MNEIRYLTINDIVEKENYPFSIGQMRHFLMCRHKNGLKNAVRKIGKRLYIRKDLFDEWIESQREDRYGMTSGNMYCEMSSGNVFADLGIENPEEELEKAKKLFENKKKWKNL